MDKETQTTNNLLDLEAEAINYIANCLKGEVWLEETEETILSDGSVVSKTKRKQEKVPAQVLADIYKRHVAAENTSNQGTGVEVVVRVINPNE